MMFVLFEILDKPRECLNQDLPAFPQGQAGFQESLIFLILRSIEN